MSPAEVLQAARMAADILLMLAPNDAAVHLSDAEVRRANFAADMAEALKFAQDADTEPEAK